MRKIAQKTHVFYDRLYRWVCRYNRPIISAVFYRLIGRLIGIGRSLFFSDLSLLNKAGESLIEFQSVSINLSQSQSVSISLTWSQSVLISLNQSQSDSISLSQSQSISISLSQSPSVPVSLNESQSVSVSLNESQ